MPERSSTTTKTELILDDDIVTVLKNNDHLGECNENDCEGLTSSNITNEKDHNDIIVDMDENDHKTIHHHKNDTNMTDNENMDRHRNHHHSEFNNVYELIHIMMAEMTGTFIIVQLGTGAVMSALYTDGLTDLISIAIVWIIAVTLAISVSASISGAHLNPAITIAFALLRPKSTIGYKKILPYIIAQFIGAILASCVNLIIYGESIQQYELDNNIVRSSSNAIPSAKAFGEYYTTTTSRAFFVEAFGSFVLAAVVFSLTHPHNTLIHKVESHSNVFIPPLIGCTVGGLISTLAPITQAGFNPARDFGPRFVAYFAGWTSVAFSPNHSWFVYIIGPIIGAVLGAAYVDLILFRPRRN
jgi:glycerol uptake facilitator protein